ncbi:mRNA-degrading endonuclease RelE of RelBE toxin-antitoxin system [Desulfosalsimonas propionicica]|uniref:mRNA-degrading endonuclease RelE of RelBE toxin-antitoxin system n=1 Tax=Desulfosalsimonas propionicica TaxID=332175 RepID=A0A7W0HL08_9BACT|nr:hypothetical protein [Desulfosalsimonas propionicica]MBA2881824.1 mRNA-degrading endonuclease RelE of RelBE toxin-antitoxin system [Desulfosalsimonas propionicica]
MSIQIQYPGNVGREFKGIFKTYPKSKKRIKDTIKTLKKNPRQGDRYPGFEGLEVRKLRIGLKEYKISKRNGLRLMFLYLPEKSKILLLTVYTKKHYGKESEIKTIALERLREFGSETALNDFDLL